MTRALVITGGHPFDDAAFSAVLDDLASTGDVEVTRAGQPEAQACFAAERAAGFDVFVMYDMPGVRFAGGGQPVELVEPPASFVADAVALLDAGKGMVFLHHAIAGWAAWEEWAHVIGGRFHYRPSELDGVAYPDSGYRHHVTHAVDVVADHRVTGGVPASFEITDELYLAPVLEQAVEPLLRSRHRFTDDGFFSADLAVRGRRDARDGWTHPAGSDLVGWVKHAGRSPVVYLQFGDGPASYAHPVFRQLLANAVAWAASPGAHEWARARRAQRGTFA